MPSTRTITGTIKAPTGAAVANARIVFELQGSGFAVDGQYPPRTTLAVTGNDGTFSVALWPNTLGIVATSYLCRLPTGEAFSFILPEGDGSPITLTDVRALGEVDVNWSEQPLSTFALLKSNNLSDVPNKPAALINLGARNADGSVSASAINLDTAATPTSQEGQIRWNAADKCAEVVQDGGVVLQVGQELTVRARNNTGGALTNGTPVYVTGATGNRPTIAKADADARPTAETLIGLVTDTAGIANNADGHVTVFGLVRELNTSGFSEGATLYLSDGTSGTFTATKPTTASSFVVRVGYVLRSHVSQGVILVSPQYMGSVSGDGVLNAASAAAIRSLIGLGYFATGTDATNLTGTLNAARIADGSLSIAKTGGLQAALDAKANASATVNLTGAQTVAGEKTFSDTIRGNVTVLGNAQLQYPFRFGKDAAWSINRFATTYGGGQAAVAELVGLHHNYDRSITNRPMWGMRFEENYDISASPGPYAGAISEFYWEWKEPIASGERYVRPLYMTIFQPAASAENPANYGSKVFSGRVGLDWWFNDWRMGRRFRDNLSDPNTDNQFKFWARWDLDGDEASDGIAALYLRDNHKLDVGGFTRLRGGMSIGNSFTTTLASSATANRTITLPDATGTVLLTNGNGSALTNLNASALASGTIPDARFPATLPAVSGANLTALNASNLSSGTVALARLPVASSGTSSATQIVRADDSRLLTAASLSEALSQTASRAIRTEVLGAAMASVYVTEFVFGTTPDFTSSTVTGSGSAGLSQVGNCEIITGSTAGSTARKTASRRGIASGTGLVLAVNFSLPVAISCTLNIRSTNATGRSRIWFGSTPTTSGANIGLGAARGIGWDIRGTRLWGQVHNGTSATFVDTGYDFPDTSTTPRTVVYSDGSGNVSFVVNGSVTTTAGGPTGTTGTDNTLHIAATNDSASADVGMVLRTARLIAAL